MDDRIVNSGEVTHIDKMEAEMKNLGKNLSFDKRSPRETTSAEEEGSRGRRRELVIQI